ncbi:MAG: hemolysin III family protein [Peptococcaceae bacterium]|nr:hemolysin III family protein [Peptococcaceae bacterium]
MSYMTKAREPFSSFSHFVGAIIFAVATVLLIGKTLITEAWNIKILIGVTVFGVSLVALYSASAIYHFSNGTAKKILRLRKLDHSMIYVLIAGSYTPILLKYLPQRESLIFVTVIWACAVVGTIIKLCWFSAPRWLQTLLYIAMGWAVLFDVSVFRDMSGVAVFLLAAGGISYTVGGIIYIVKKPNLSKNFGFHELFHLFILLGSIFHYLMVLFYVA